MNKKSITVLCLILVIVASIVAIKISNSINKPKIEITNLSTYLSNEKDNIIPSFDVGEEFKLYHSFKFNFPTDTLELEWAYNEDCLELISNKSVYDIDVSYMDVKKERHYYNKFKVKENLGIECFEKTVGVYLFVRATNNIRDSEMTEMKIIPKNSKYCEQCGTICSGGEQ